MTKQAAHERFVAAPLAWPQNFSVAARAVVARALKEARGFGHRSLGTEHLLLALSAEPGLAGATLADLGVSEHGYANRSSGSSGADAPAARQPSASLRAPNASSKRR